MSVSLKSLGIDRLSLEERLALVEELWDSIADSGTDLPLTDAQRAELDRRLGGMKPSRMMLFRGKTLRPRLAVA